MRMFQRKQEQNKIFWGLNSEKRTWSLIINLLVVIINSLMKIIFHNYLHCCLQHAWLYVSLWFAYIFQGPFHSDNPRQELKFHFNLNEKLSKQYFFITKQNFISCLIKTFSKSVNMLNLFTILTIMRLKMWLLWRHFVT